MEENPPRVPRKDWTQEGRKVGPTRRSRYTVDDGGDFIECSGKYCRSCTTGLVADCVALCCCPCAVLNILTLAFVKVPYMVGRKCLGRGKKKRKCKKVEGACGFVLERDGSLNKVLKDEVFEIASPGFLDDDQEEMGGRVSAKSEAERVWLELYEVGHLGFGRTSYTGIQPQDKGN